MKNLLIRPAQHADLDQLLRLYEEFQQYYLSSIPEYLRDLALPGYAIPDEFLARLRRAVAGPDSAILVADVEKQIIGLSEIYFNAGELPDTPGVSHPYAYMQSLVVSTPSRSQGIGMLLVDAAEEWAREKGALEVRLEPLEFKESLFNFYERLGYRTIRRTMARNLTGDTQ